MKSIVLAAIALAGSYAFASNQSISCYGRYETANLQLEFLGEGISHASVSMRVEEDTYEAELPKRKVNRAKGTVTYSQTRGPIKVTIPLRWEDRGFERFSKHDARGSEISEQTDFQYARGQTLSISECESDVD